MTPDKTGTDPEVTPVVKDYSHRENLGRLSLKNAPTESVTLLDIQGPVGAYVRSS